MPFVRFLPSDKTVEVPCGTSLFDVAKQADVSVSVPCGCKGVCGKCLVKIEKGTVDFDEENRLLEELLNDNYVLICKAKVTQSDLTVFVPSDIKSEKGKFSDTLDDMLRIPQSLMPDKENLSPFVKTVKIDVAAPSVGDGLSDYDRFEKAVIKTLNVQSISLPLEILRTLPEILRDCARRGDGSLAFSQEDKRTVPSSCLSFYRNNNIASIVSLNSTLPENQYGLAIDIGTTTVAVMLCDMLTGEVVNVKTGYNRQIECGLDVISRINYSLKPDKLEELRQKILQTINLMICEICAENKITPTEILSASIAANTTMVHLLLGVVSEYIRLDPYTPCIYNMPIYNSYDIGLEICPFVPVFIAPSVGSYVGGDITSGALCTCLSEESDEIALFIDIGTNGEILLGNNDFLLGCACSAGPAFEGGGISCGMRASSGAIERVEIDSEKNITCFTINNADAEGICGSGIISLISQLFKNNMIDPKGRFTGGEKSLCLVPGKNKNIIITETDIDNFIRAKAAVFSAVRQMLNSVEMDFDCISKVYVAGGFGRYLDLENSKTIGLLPPIDKENFIFLGNSSLMGAYMTLLSENHREKINEIKQKITYLDLSSEAGYMDEYMAAMFLPHTDESLFK